MTHAAPPATDEARLYAAILDAPADDAPRLIYADWLDEHDQGERAEFVRLQIDIARREKWLADNDVTGELSSEDKIIRKMTALQRRERGLLTASWDRWCDPVPGHVYGCVGVTKATRRMEPMVWYEFRRGFIDRVELSLAAFLGGPECHACGLPDPITGEETWPNPDCSTCKGSGRTPGAAAALGRLPLRADGVTLVDREPGQDSATPVARWWNAGRSHAADYGHPQSEIPEELFRRLTGAVENNGRLAVYPTRELADRALATACVSYARRLVGVKHEPTIPEEVA